MKKTFHELCNDVRKNVKECTVKEVMEMKKNSEDFLLVDIREDNEFEKGRIKDSVHIGKGIIERDIHMHVKDHDKKIVLYCGGGFRSLIAAESLQKMGYSKVVSMNGGWRGWNAAGGETETG
ncbi:MAG: rhodanese-like domain-containing protein [Bacteroidetes bacterium]|nr:rhodanese-like domain-containing protein [Bacteroidota bacterium]